VTDLLRRRRRRRLVVIVVVGGRRRVLCCVWNCSLKRLLPQRTLLRVTCPSWVNCGGLRVVVCELLSDRGECCESGLQTVAPLRSSAYLSIGGKVCLWYPYQHASIATTGVNRSTLPKGGEMGRRG